MADPQRARDQIARCSADVERRRHAGWQSGSYAKWMVIATRFVSALVFLVFGAGKFTNHASELASFQTYGLPVPDAFVYGVGVVEVAGGALLAVGLAVRPAALALAADMIGAIVVSGIGRGETVSLTLAPALLVAMLFLLLVGSRERSTWPFRRRTKWA